MLRAIRRSAYSKPTQHGSQISVPTGDIIGAPSDKASVTGVPNAMWRRVSTAIMTYFLLCAQTVQAKWFQAPEYSRQEIAALASAATPPRSLYLGAAAISGSTWKGSVRAI